MAKAYEDDRRRMLLQAYDRGEGTLAQLAERFGVSVAWAWKISAQRKHSGKMERVEQRRGTRRKFTTEVERYLRRLLRGNRNWTLTNLQLVIANHLYVQVSTGRLCQVLHLMGLRLERSRSKPSKRAWDRVPAIRSTHRKKSCYRE